MRRSDLPVQPRNHDAGPFGPLRGTSRTGPRSGFSAGLGASLPLRLLGWGIAAAAGVLVVIAPADTWGQLLFSFVTVAVCAYLGGRQGDLSRLMLIGLSLLVSSRYMYWRTTQTLSFQSGFDLVFGMGLFLAELYYFIVLLLGHFQVLWPLRRRPVALPADPQQWPTVDVLIPTYNEPLELVRITLMAARVMDWPEDKLKVHLLDDGRRPEFRELCRELGINYLIRGNNRHAKAGNINAALARTQGEYVAIFDCDHVATRSFLQLTMGWFLKDRRLALMQTPHYYFSADPLERNLGNFGTIPNEGELFYGLLQPGNDLWDATFFCGSCAVLRRSALEQVGGVATETVTEDAHTALKLHRRGYRSAYLAIPQAAGLATESLSSHVGQRIRWARGMIQIFRIDNPLLGRGLSLPQRLCYLNAMLHFLYGLPRLVFLTSPLANLLFGLQIIHAPALLVLVYAAPHVLVAYLSNKRSQGRYRHMLWNEIYEAVLAWYILPPTLLALINPRLGSFNVTAKGGLVQKSFFDVQIARPYLLVLLLNLVGVGFGLWWLLHSMNAGQTQTTWMNLLWTGYNIMIVGGAIAAARESRQVREAHRVPVNDMTVRLHVPGGDMYQARVVDFSTNGLAVQSPSQELMPGTVLLVGLSQGDNERFLPAVIANDKGGGNYGLKFEHLSTEQRAWLVSCTFSQADLWSSRWGGHDRERFFRTAGRVVMASIRGLLYLLGHLLFLRRRVRQESA